MEDSNNVHHPLVAVLCWDLSFTPIQVYQMSTGPVSQGSPESHIAQLSRLVAVRSLKTNAGSVSQGSPESHISPS